MTNKPGLPSWLTAALPFLGADQPLVTVIELDGPIGVNAPGRKGLSGRKLEKTIDQAFKPSKLAAVALAINSPGGSPVQSRLIFSQIRRLAEEKKVPVLAFIEDVGASGGYILAISADEIFADESSIVGSIGVVSGSFGFVDAIKKLGVERRLYTAGENKAQLDPFKPEDPEDRRRLDDILNALHRQFIDLVKSRRADRLKDDPEIFTGAFWTGDRALELGLIDGTARLGEFLRRRYGEKVKIRRLSPSSGSLLQRLMGGAAASPALDPDAVLDAAERRAIWARFGL